MAVPRRSLDILLFGGLILLSMLVVRGWVKEGDSKNQEAPVVKAPKSVSQEAPLPPIRPGPAPEAVPIDGALPLLDRIDPKADAIGNAWTLEKGRLITPAVKWARLQIPCVPTEEYDFYVTLTRLQMEDAFVLGMVYQGRQCQAVLDANGGKRSWMEVKGGGHGVTDYGITYFEGPVLVKNRPAEVRVSVRKSRLTLLVDGFHVLDWVGPKDRLFIADNWDVPEKRVLFLGAWETVFAVDHLRIVPIGGSVTFLR